jgi:anaerobic selenocysteine-containing dehydrogenase/ferredoxin-NADP reductase
MTANVTRHALYEVILDEIPGYCTLCRSRCGSLNYVEAGKLVKVAPYPDHPTGGALCAKGRAAPELLGSPDRLGRPLKRTRPRDDGDAGWVEISWDEALDEIAARLSSIRSESGAEAVAFAVTTPSGTPMVDSFEWVERFVRCFGSPNLIYAIEVCGWHKDFAHALTFGRGIGVPDLDEADVVVLWGHNPARTWLAQASRIAAARQRGAQVVVIDPKQDGSGQQADLWLRIRPGADGALAMGAIRHLLVTKSYDLDFVGRWTNAPMLVDLDTGRLLRAREIWADVSAESYVIANKSGQAQPCDPRQVFAGANEADLHASITVRDAAGRTRHCRTVFDLLYAAVSSYTVEQVAETTWLAPELIERFNALYEGTPKLAYHAWTGVGQHTNATMTERAIATLYSLTGACDRPGGNLWTVPLPVNPVNEYSLLSESQQLKALGLGDLPLGPPRYGWITARDFCAAVLERKPYPVRALVSFGTNFVVSQADSARNQRALHALDFHVHVDTFMNPTAQGADIVLPANLPWEREALKTGFEITQAAVEHVQLRPRMLAPFESSRADYEIVFALAMRLGLASQFFDGSVESGWNHQLEPLGITVEDLRATQGGIRFRQPFQYEKYGCADSSGQIAGFATPTRRVEIYSEALLDLGQPALACFVEPAASPLRPDPNDRYPLVLTTAKSGWFVHSSHRQIASLRKKAPDPCVQIGAGLAMARGIQQGDWICVSTPAGNANLRARIDDKLDDRVVIADFGWWQGCTSFARSNTPAVGETTSSINAVLSDSDRDPISGSVPLRATLCEISRDDAKNRGRWDGLRKFSIVARGEPAEDIVSLKFAPLDSGALPDFLPGQHVTLTSERLGITRAYSLTGANVKPSTLSIAVKRVTAIDRPQGKMSNHLHGLEIGDVVSLGPPNGVFTPPLESTRPVIMMASGIGITPFLGYLEALAASTQRAEDPRVLLVNVCRNRSAHPFSKRLTALASQSARVSIVTYYWDPQPDDRVRLDYDRAGNPTAELFDDKLVSRRPLAYLCGAPRFLAESRDLLVARGIPSFDIFSETFTSDVGVPANLLPQMVSIADSDERFVWSARCGTLLDGADAAGISLPSGCRVGQCESCAMQIVSGEVAHLSPYDGPPDRCLTCQAVPLSAVKLKR